MGRLNPPYRFARRRALLRPGVLLLTLLWAHTAHADEGDDLARAKELFENGTTLYDEGSYEAAVSAFKEAYNLSNEPLMLYNMASALERLGRWQEALDALDGYRAFAPADEREQLERRIRSLETRLSEQRAQEQQQVATVRRGPDPIALALVGAGAVGIGTGTVFSLRTHGVRGEWQALCREGLCPSEVDALYQQDRSSALLADVAMGVGLVALGTGVAVGLLRKGSRAADAEVALTVGPGRVAVGGRW